MSERVRRRVRDEEVVAVLLKVILEEGTVSSQARLTHLVNVELAAQGASVSPARLRVLAVRSGLVSVAIRARIAGQTPLEMDACPVCRARLRRTVNRTLTGDAIPAGYRCTRCPWWTGRELRMPHHYVFQARVSRARGRREQLAFTPPVARREKTADDA